MRIPYGFNLTSLGALEIKENEAETVHMIFDYYLARASLGKVVDMLFKKHIPSPTGKAKWACAAVDHLLPTLNILLLLALSLSQMCSLKHLPSAMLIMTRRVHREKKHVMLLLLCSQCDFCFTIPQYLL